MSLPPPEYRFASPSIRITAWEDPVIDLLGHDPRSPYVERFWLSVLGPSTTFLLRHIAAQLDEQPEGFDLVVEDVARALGLGTRNGMGSPFIRAIARTGQFKLSQACGPDALAVRRRIPSLSLQQVTRLPIPLRDAHDAWQHDARQDPTPEQRRTRARRLALSLLELGESEEATEQQLHRWRIHPALAHEAMRWAQLRRGQTPSTPEPALRPPVVAAPVRVLASAGADGGAAPIAPPSRPRIGASRPAPPSTHPTQTSFGPYDPPDAA